jgi:hypothetical protein
MINPLRIKKKSTIKYILLRIDDADECTSEPPVNKSM